MVSIMLRFLGAATLVLAGASCLVAFDFDRERRATPDLSLGAYLDQQRLRLESFLAPLEEAAPAKGHDLSRMANIESTSSGPPGTDFFGIINRTVYGTKTKPTIGIGMCRVEVGRKTCSPFAD